MIPPCGVPVIGSITRPSSSRIPAFSHFWISHNKALSSTRSASILSIHSWSRLSKNPWMSASAI